MTTNGREFFDIGCQGGAPRTSLNNLFFVYGCDLWLSASLTAGIKVQIQFGFADAMRRERDRLQFNVFTDLAVFEQM